ncbi:MAG: SGNH/GDSL hydrolase family protein, partial [bacterium]
MKTILCYGDSNTWGYDPRTTDRYPRQIRWTGVFAAALEAAQPGGFEVVAEGLNGRTTVWDDPFGEKNGSKYLLPCLETHKPLDLVIIMLGTNDLKSRFGVSSWDVAKGVAWLAGLVRASGAGPVGAAPMVLAVSPPPFGRMGAFTRDFVGGPEKSRTLGRDLCVLAEENGIPFFDAGSVIRSSDVDGIHLDPGDHAILGRALAAEAVSLLG